MATQTLTRPAPRTAAGPAVRKPRRKITAGKAAVTAVAAVLAVLWLVPFAWATATAFKSEPDAAAPEVSWFPPSGFTADAFVKVFQEGFVQGAYSYAVLKPGNHEKGRHKRKQDQTALAGLAGTTQHGLGTDKI